MQLVLLGVIVLVTSITGTMLVRDSHAATAVVSVEAEAGTASASVRAVNDAAASGGKAIAFAATSTGGGTATRTTNCTPAPSATMTNAVSHLCGFPDATNTGVPTGTALIQVPTQATSGPGWHWDTRGWVQVDGANALFSGYEIHADVLVSGNGATVQNCRIISTGNGMGVGIQHASNVTVQHNTISGTTNGGLDNDRLTIAIKDIYGDVTGTKAIANNIWDVSAGITFDDGLIQDNYIHDMGYNASDHVDSTQSFGPGALLVQHNTLLNQSAQTATMLWSTTLGPQGGHTANNNLLAGGGYVIYPGNDEGAPNQKVTNNHFSRMFFPNSGSYGIMAHYDTSAPGWEFSGNIWDDTGAPISL